NFTRSNSGTSGDSASSKTRALNSSQLSSRFRKCSERNSCSGTGSGLPFEIRTFDGDDEPLLCDDYAVAQSASRSNPLGEASRRTYVERTPTLPAFQFFAMEGERKADAGRLSYAESVRRRRNRHLCYQPYESPVNETWRREYPFRSHFLDLDGVRLHYLD